MNYQKFGNKPTVVNGIKFQSRLESDRYQQLLLLEKAGEICDLTLQMEFQIFHGYRDPETGEKEKSAFYVADFVYLDCKARKWIAEDTKGVETKEFRLKWKLVKQRYPDYTFRILKRSDV